MSVVRILSAAALAGSVLLVAPSPSSAAPVDPADLCTRTQFALGLIDEQAFDAAGLSVLDETFADFADFVSSKSGVDPSTGQILSTSFVEPDPADPTVAKQLRCKVRTGESLDKGAWPQGSDNNSPGFERPEFFGFGAVAAGVSGGRGTCRTINDAIIDQVWSALTPAQQQASAFRPDDGTLVTAPDDEALFGPVWTAPFEPTAIEAGVLTVRSKSLYAPTTDTSGIGPRFLGAHYCTLVGPDYLAAIIAANSEPIPTPTPTPTPSVTTPAPVPSATTTTTTGPGFLAEPTTTAAPAPTAGTAGGALPETGASVGVGLVGALALAVGLALVARTQRWTLVPAGSGRHRARH